MNLCFCEFAFVPVELRKAHMPGMNQCVWLGKSANLFAADAWLAVEGKGFQRPALGQPGRSRAALQLENLAMRHRICVPSTSSSVGRPLLEASSFRRDSVSGLRCISIAVNLRTLSGAVKSNCFHAERRRFPLFLAELLETEWMALSEGFAREHRGSGDRPGRDPSESCLHPQYRRSPSGRWIL